METPSNFGQLGARPTHPELLDYLAARLVENKWSIKSCIARSCSPSTYALSSEDMEPNNAVDADNPLVLAGQLAAVGCGVAARFAAVVSGNLDLNPPAEPRSGFSDDRTTPRRLRFRQPPQARPMLALFDFPIPNNTGEQRMCTNVPSQRLFLMNSSFVESRRGVRHAPVSGDRTRIRCGRRIGFVYGRLPDAQELQLGAVIVRREGGLERSTRACC